MFLRRQFFCFYVRFGCHLRYWIGHTILIQFNEVVNVQGTSTIELETGDTDATAYYASGTGTDTLTFNYTVLSTHVAVDLDYKATTSLALPTGSIP